MDRPAILGGPPAFSDPVAFARPSRPPLERVVVRVASSYDSGILTNGPLVRELEERVADRLGVRAVVAVSSCTSGLMLAIRALDLDGPVVLPSFTFSASAHAVAWNGLAPRFADCLPTTLQVDVDDAAGRLENAAALLATHVFGAPCDATGLEALAMRRGIPLVFDAAHAFGARHRQRPIGGFGIAEVFSLSPTKPLVAGEGGLVATNDDGLAARVRLGRDYGNPGDYNTQFVGLNARMSEFHAATALESLEQLDESTEVRQALAKEYIVAIGRVPGVRTQVVSDEDVSTYKDFTVVFDDEFGLSRDMVAAGLLADGFDTRKYFSPPVHRQASYADVPTPDLPVTDDIAGRVLSLPFHCELPDGALEQLEETLLRLHCHAEEVRAVME